MSDDATDDGPDHSVTDDRTNGGVTDDGGAPTEQLPGRRPSPGAAAASRARRIGGRPSPIPRPAEDTVGVQLDKGRHERPTATTRAAAPETERPGRGRPSRLGRPSRPDRGAKPDSPPRPARSRGTGQLRVAAAAIATTAAVVLAAVCVWLSHGVWWDKPGSDNGLRNSSRQQVMAAAKTCIAALTNYDYRTLPANEKAGNACATGSFKTSYDQAMTTIIEKYAPTTKTVQVYQPIKAGIVSVSSDGTQWVVLLYGQQQVTNSTTGTKTPRLDLLSAQVTLNKVGTQWLVSNVVQAAQGS